LEVTLVQGHLDGVGKFLALTALLTSENWWLHIEIPAEVEKYAVYKGSICIEESALPSQN